MPFNRSILSLLSTHVGTGKLISVYANQEDTDKFFVGCLLKVDEESVLLRLRGNFGEDEGVLIVPLEGVLRISTANDYLNGIQLLMQRIPASESDIDDFIKSPEPASILSALSFAKRRGLVVTIYDEEEEQLNGFVREVSPDHVDLEYILDHGQPEGRYLLPISSISRVEMGNQFHDCLRYLYSKRLGLV